MLRGVYKTLTLAAENGNGSMNGGAMRQCRGVLLGLSAAALVTLAGCSTMQKTFDFSPDPELKKNAQYPNINIGGAPQPGTPLTPDQQEQAKTQLKAAATAASPDIGTAAKEEGAKSAADLDALAKNHAATTLKEIQNGCGTDQVVDATKCTQ